MNKEEKILEILIKQQEAISTVIQKQNAHDARFDHIESRFNRIETAVLETNRKIVKIDKIEKNLDTAITNHESRIRRIETIIHK